MKHQFFAPLRETLTPADMVLTADERLLKVWDGVPDHELKLQDARQVLSVREARRRVLALRAARTAFA